MILLTGYNGFIGNHFKNKLNLNNIVAIEQNDCFDFLKNYSNWEKIKLIIHQGAISSTVENNINTIHHYNVDFTLSLFEKAIKYKIPVKYASSASVYGHTNNHYNPLNYYAISKLQIDYWVQDNLKDFEFIQGFRYFNVYGSGEEHKKDQASPISKFTKQILENKKIKIFQNSENYIRDFICVDDVIKCVLNNNKDSGIYDLGTSNPISFKNVAELIVNKYGGEIETIPFPEHLKNKYQSYTCSKNEWGEYNFKTVKEYLS